MGNCHFDGSASRYHSGVDKNVPSYLHRVLQIALHLVQNILAGSSQQNSTCFRVLALGDVGEVPVICHFESLKNHTEHRNRRFKLRYFKKIASKLHGKLKVSKVTQREHYQAAVKIVSEIDSFRDKSSTLVFYYNYYSLVSYEFDFE